MALFVVGAGGLGRETLDGALAAHLVVTAFVDEHVVGGTCRGLPIVDMNVPRCGDEFVVGIADPRARRRLAEELQRRGAQPRTVVHPRAAIAPRTNVGTGAVILANAYISSGVAVGAHVHVNYNATVGHDTVLDDYVTVLPGANVAGNVHLGEGVTVGTSACVLQGLQVGEYSVVGAGGVLTRSAGSKEVLVGVPAVARPRD